MQIDPTHRNRLRLWRRWQITFDWFNYTPPIQRVHQALMIHQGPWSTWGLSAYTNIPQTSVRRVLRELDKGKSIVHEKNGVMLNELGLAYAINFTNILIPYVRGGCHLDKNLLTLLKQGPNNEAMNWEMLENHVWLPVIDASGIFDA
ncbi:hypothetical protein ACFORG_15280 [Lutimaribacter marinistellae]|uniref:Uncharacterized protein n=1 Tax=Lutimaribacter marinistellae TaxID=1820329 RepID=A0ABV7TIK3_9RHOB